MIKIKNPVRLEKEKKETDTQALWCQQKTRFSLDNWPPLLEYDSCTPNRSIHWIVISTDVPVKVSLKRENLLKSCNGIISLMPKKLEHNLAHIKT